MLDVVCRRLRELSARWDTSDLWPSESWRMIAQAGVLRWFIPAQWGGLEWSEADLLAGYARLSSACLTTAFILTQWAGACRRIVVGESDAARTRWLTALARGDAFTTVAISHLTTSRRHLGSPVLRARETDSGYVLDGYSAWVTGAMHSDVITTAASLDDGRQVILAVERDSTVRCSTAHRLVALAASQTSRVDFQGTPVPREFLLAGPSDNVLGQAAGAVTGGLVTSALALGLAGAAVDYLTAESKNRPDLKPPADGLAREAEALSADLTASANDACPSAPDALRARANSLALRASQAALAAAKGNGFVSGHSAGRWCREALFFLVWSCPQTVVNAQLCEFAGLD